MSSARIVRPFHIATSFAALSIVVAAHATPPQSVDLPLPERGKPALSVSAPIPVIPKAMFLPLAEPPSPSARPIKRRTSQSRTPKPSPGGGTAAERAADFDSRGNFAMQAGQTAEAIGAFEHALKLAPTCIDAWGKLAYLYLKTGDSARAIEAFKQAKQFGDANCGMVTRDASGALLLFP
jgi:hypothetical protein